MSCKKKQKNKRKKEREREFLQWVCRDVHFRADRVLWLESLSDPKSSLLDLAATGPKVLFGLCSLESPPLESAVGRGGPGGRRGPGSASPIPAEGRESGVAPGVEAAAAAPVDGDDDGDGEASAAVAAAAVVVGIGAVERSRLALVVCGRLGVTVGRGALGKAAWEGAEVPGSTEDAGRSEACVAVFSFLLQDSQQSLLYPGIEQYRARTSIWQKIDLSPRHGSSGNKRRKTPFRQWKQQRTPEEVSMDALWERTLTWRDFVDRGFRCPFVFYRGVSHCFNAERRHWLPWREGQD